MSAVATNAERLLRVRVDHVTAVRLGQPPGRSGLLMTVQELECPQHLGLLGVTSLSGHRGHLKTLDQGHNPLSRPGRSGHPGAPTTIKQKSDHLRIHGGNGPVGQSVTKAT